MTAKSAVAIEKTDKIPPRERILAAAADLFYRNGIRAVGVDAIAEAAGTNKMTLYRHFVVEGRAGGGISAAVRQGRGRRLGLLAGAASRRSPGAASRLAQRDVRSRRQRRRTRLPAGQRRGRAAGQGSSGPARDRGMQGRGARQGDRALPGGRPRRSGVSGRRAQPDAGRRARHRAERRHRRARRAAQAHERCADRRARARNNAVALNLPVAAGGSCCAGA